MTKSHIQKEILSWIVVIALALLIIFILQKKVFILNTSIPSGSMENTLMVGDKLITNRLAYVLNEPKRGDIVVFKFPDDESQIYIKRIIGLPGETIEGKDGYVYLNGTLLEEDYVKEQLEEDFGPYEVPEDSYFVMGDNRNESEDSRFWENTFLNKDKILGKANFRYYPNFQRLR